MSHAALLQKYTAIAVVVRAQANWVLGWDAAGGTTAIAALLALGAAEAWRVKGAGSVDTSLVGYTATASAIAAVLPVVAYLQHSCGGAALGSAAASRDAVYPVLAAAAAAYRSNRLARGDDKETSDTASTSDGARLTRTIAAATLTLIPIVIVVIAALGFAGVETCNVAGARDDVVVAVSTLSSIIEGILAATAFRVCCSDVEPDDVAAGARSAFTAASDEMILTPGTRASLADVHSGTESGSPANRCFASALMERGGADAEVQSVVWSQTSASPQPLSTPKAIEELLREHRSDTSSSPSSPVPLSTAWDAAVLQCATPASEILGPQAAAAGDMVRKNSVVSFAASATSTASVAGGGSALRKNSRGGGKRGALSMRAAGSSAVVSPVQKSGSQHDIVGEFEALASEDGSGVAPRPGPLPVYGQAIEITRVDSRQDLMQHAGPSSAPRNPLVPPSPTVPLTAGEFRKRLFDAVAEDLATTSGDLSSEADLVTQKAIVTTVRRLSVPVHRERRASVSQLTDIHNTPAMESTFAVDDFASRSFESELKVLWLAFDPDDTGYLTAVDCANLLEVLGVDMHPDTASEFADITVTGGTCARDVFIEAYEGFRRTEMFRSYYGRVRLSAIASVFNGNTAQTKVMRTWNDFDENGDGNLDLAELIPILKVLGMPHEEDDIRELFSEFSKGHPDDCDAIEYTDFISIFSCDHPALVKETSFEQNISAAKVVIDQLKHRETSRRHGTKVVVFQDPKQQVQDRRNALRKVVLRCTCVVLLYAVYNFCRVSYRIVFENGAAVPLGLLFLDLLSDAILWAWVGFRVGVPVEAGGVNVIVDVAAIVRNALSRKYLLEVVMAVPVDWVGVALYGRYLNPFWRLNKLLLVFRIPEMFRSTTEALALSPIPVRIGGALAILIMQAHVLGCLFKLTADNVSDAAVESVTTLGPNHNSLYYSQLPKTSQYLHSFDYALKTGSGWGRGSPIPQDDTLVMQATIIVFLGVASYAFVLASISNALQIRTQSTAFVERMDEVKSFLDYSGLPEDTRHACTQYYLHMYRTTGSTDSDIGQVIFNDLPHELDVAIRLVQARHILSRVPIFVDAISNDYFLFALSLKLRTDVLCPGEVVTEKGQPGSNMYFITHGECDIVNPAGETVFTLEKGNFFGEIALLHNVRRTATVIARTFCNVLVLDKVDFDEVCNLYPDALNHIRLGAFDRLKAIIIEEAMATQRQLGDCAPEAHRRSSMHRLGSLRRKQSNGSLFCGRVDSGPASPARQASGDAESLAQDASARALVEAPMGCSQAQAQGFDRSVFVSPQSTLTHSVTAESSGFAAAEGSCISLQVAAIAATSVATLSQAVAAVPTASDVSDWIDARKAREGEEAGDACGASTYMKRRRTERMARIRSQLQPSAESSPTRRSTTDGSEGGGSSSLAGGRGSTGSGPPGTRRSHFPDDDSPDVGSMRK